MRFICRRACFLCSCTDSLQKSLCTKSFHVIRFSSACCIRLTTSGLSGGKSSFSQRASFQFTMFRSRTAHIIRAFQLSPHLTSFVAYFNFNLCKLSFDCVSNSVLQYSIINFVKKEKRFFQSLMLCYQKLQVQQAQMENKK